MTSTSHRKDANSHVASVYLVEGGAIFNLVISASIGIAWILHLDRLEQFLPPLLEMKFNSAIGFAAVSFGLFSQSRGWRIVAVSSAALGLMIGVVTIAEYGGLREISIDQILVRDWSRYVGLAGRSPLNTAAVLALASSAVFALGFARQSRTRDAFIGSISLIIIAAAMESLAGHIAGSPFALGWGTGQSMSIPSIVCAMVIGSGLMAYGWPVRTTAEDIPLWIPGIIAFAIMLFDAYTPVEINAAICYIPLVLSASRFRRPNISIYFAFISTVLVIFGLFTSPPGTVTIGIAAFNRFLAVFAIWIIAFLIRFQVTARHALEDNSVLITSANRELTSALSQRDILLREVYHRVKNNMQMVDSLALMQAREFADPDVKQAFSSLRARIHALGLVHHQLMASDDLQTFDVAPFLTELATHIIDGGPSRHIGVTVNARPMAVKLDFAIPLGLLVTELVTNALNHAFRYGAGTITVDLDFDQYRNLVLVVTDDGENHDGDDTSLNFSHAGIGPKLVTALVAQLKGKMTVTMEGGRRSRIEFGQAVWS